MKKKLSLRLISSFFFFIFLPLISSAQEVVFENEIVLNENQQLNVSLDRVNLLKNGDLILYTFVQKKEENAGSGAVEPVPYLVVYKFSDSLQLQKRTEEKVKPFLGKENSKKNTAYPEFYQRTPKEEENFSAAVYLVDGPLISRTTVKYEYDWLSNSFVKPREEKRKIKMEVPDYESGALFIHDKMLTNQEQGFISMVAGNKQEADSLLFHHYTSQTIFSYNLAGKKLNQHSLNFDFPAELRLHKFVRDQEGTCRGTVYIFGSARRFGHKITDPDPVNYKLVWLDTQGKLIFEHSFKYGSKKCFSEPFFAGADREQLYIMGKGVGKEPDFHLMTFNSQGLKNLTLVDRELLYSKTEGDYHKGISHDYNSHLKPDGFRITKKGELVVFGEHSFVTKNAWYDPETNSQMPPEHEYRSIAFLHFNKEGLFMKNYVVSGAFNNDPLKPADITFLTEGEEEIHFMVSGHLSPDAEQAEPQMFGTLPGREAVCKNCEAEPGVPALLSLNLYSEKVNSLRFSEGMVNFREDPFFLLNEDKSTLLWMGKPAGAGFPVKILLKKIQLTGIARSGKNKKN